MKKILFFIVAALCAMNLTISAQNNGEVKKQTKFEVFSSKTGSIIKFIDVKMPNISTLYSGSLKTSIRTIKHSPNDAYFYRIEQPETQRSNEHIAMIEYSDLVEINKAISRLGSEVQADCHSNPDYLENKFTTEDGFVVGYYVSKGEATWYLKLERYSSSTVFVRDAVSISETFHNAQLKIEEIKGSK